MSLTTLPTTIINLNQKTSSLNSQTSFAQDVSLGLNKKSKTLSSRYFYDGLGSQLFQQIMNLPEYYLTRCEHEIFTGQKEVISQAFAQNGFFHLVDLGAGDALKTKILIKELVRQDVNFEYVPVDISGDAMLALDADFRIEIPQVKVQAIVGDYFSSLEWLHQHKPKRKIILFLGSNIGNFTKSESIAFLQQIRQHLEPGDLLFLGVDLKKEPAIILRAYADATGVTAEFNLNLLRRINRELGGNFQVDQFMHHAMYNPLEGVMQSFLISRIKQDVCLAATGETIQFEAWEAIHTENSHKYSQSSIAEMAQKSSFRIDTVFQDQKNYFADILLIAD